MSEDKANASTYQKAKLWILLSAAAVLVIVALIWSCLLSNSGAQSKLCHFLNSYGYHVIPEDLFVAAEESDSTIQAVLSDIDLADAIQASKAAGLPSDIHKKGDIAVVLVLLSNKHILTTYLVDGEPELAFVQIPNSPRVYPLGGLDAQD